MKRIIDHPDWRKRIEDRFWPHVDVKGEDDCWEWTGPKNQEGYGTFAHPIVRSTVRAHRMALELAGHQIEGRVACHRCDNPSCCNPNHLFLGSDADNMRDASRKGRLRLQAGEANPRAKLTERCVAEIRRRIAAGETNKAIARDFPVSHSMVSRIRLGKSWHKAGTGVTKP